MSQRKSQPRLVASRTSARAHDTHSHDRVTSGRVVWIATIGLAALIGAVYGPFIHTPLIFDDLGAVTGNESITSLWPLIGRGRPGPLNPPSELPTSGRPLVNLSFAVNHELGGLDPTGYHLVNFVLHYLSALTLWGIVRRTLRLPYFHDQIKRSAEWLALAVAALWAMHPLVTEAVIYVTQRTELMMAFFYLATLYCSLRYWETLATATSANSGAHRSVPRVRSGRRASWLALAGLACVCGMASKEVMVSAPLMVLLFERTFVAGSIGNALRRSWPLYCLLSTTLVLLLVLNLSKPHSDAAGFAAGVPAYFWWLTQTKVFFLYLKLVVWPWPLYIHYEFPYLKSVADAWLYAVPLLMLGLVTLLLLWRNRPLGYLATWVFAILAPTFVIPIVTEIAAERRMYLALVSPCVLFVVGGYHLASRFLSRQRTNRDVRSATASATACGSVTIVLLFVYCAVSVTRLAAYENEKQLWLEVLQAQPNSSMAHQCVAAYFEEEGHDEAAIEHYRAAVKSNPNSSHAHYQLGLLLNKHGKFDDAATHFAVAIRTMPQRFVTANLHNSLAVALYSAGRNSEAIDEFRVALAIDPKNWLTYRNLGTALYKAGRYQEAVESLQATLRLNPQAIELYNDLAKSYRRMNQPSEALAALQQGLKLAQAVGDTENENRFRAALKAQQ